jgi:hypothetical protein
MVFAQRGCQASDNAQLGTFPREARKERVWSGRGRGGTLMVLGGGIWPPGSRSNDTAVKVPRKYRPPSGVEKGCDQWQAVRKGGEPEQGGSPAGPITLLQPLCNPQPFCAQISRPVRRLCPLEMRVLGS